MPALPPDLAQRYYLSTTPCPRQHRYLATVYTLRRRSNHGCQQCNLAYRRGARAPRNGYQQGGLPPRPPLPAHLAATAFLSPITCRDPTHRYRRMPEWTLRFVDTEACVLCTTARSQTVRAGDEPPGRPRRGQRGSQGATVSGDER